MKMNDPGGHPGLSVSAGAPRFLGGGAGSAGQQPSEQQPSETVAPALRPHPHPWASRDVGDMGDVALRQSKAAQQCLSLGLRGCTSRGI